MNIILLSGGSGKRLWPLSNDVRSKQFIKVFKSEDGQYESMIQRVYKKLSERYSRNCITIATSKSQVSATINQLGDSLNISIEPCRKDTFPAIVLSSLYLKDRLNVSEDEVIMVCPVDPYVDDGYFEYMAILEEQVKNTNSNLVLMGMEPTYPSEKYGYIIPESSEMISKVNCFKEKPSLELAKKYISQGALWNGGVFAFKLGFLIKKAHELIDFVDYEDLFNKYETLLPISFDYAVVEKEKNIDVVKFSGEWKDLGTWNTFTEAMREPIIGNGIVNDNCKGVNIINEMDIPVLAMGLNDVVISVSTDGILVSDKEQSSYIKPYVDKFESKAKFAEKSWGYFKIINVEKNSIVVLVDLKPGHSMNYHSHKRRSEIWIITSGEGEAVIDGKKIEVKPGNVINLPIGCKHTIYATTELKITEIQMGEDIDVDDKEKHKLMIIKEGKKQ